MVRHIVWSLLVYTSMGALTTYGQSLSSPRAMGIGAYGPLVNDTRSFAENPAGIVNVRDWDLSLSTYVPTIPGSQGFVFGGLAIGKRVFENVGVALQYTQGTSIEFVIPTSIAQYDTNPISIDKRVKYDEPFTASIAYKITPGISFGLSGRYLTQKITDSQYKFDIDSGYFSLLPDQISIIHLWNIDIGMLWHLSKDIAVSALGRNLLQVKSGAFPSDLSGYELPNKRYLDVGAAIQVNDAVNISSFYSTASVGALGAEYTPGMGLAFRGGMYAGGVGTPFISGFGVGAGFTFRFFTGELAYLRFTSQTDRQGTAQVREFDPTSIANIEFNRYTSDRLQFSIKATFGNVRDVLASIEAVHMTGSVYPSSYEALAFQPIGTVRVKNISDRPIEARARFYVDRFMDGPTESKPVYLGPGESSEIPIKAIFNENMKSVERMVVREGNVYVSATAAEEYDDKYSMPMLIHGRNDWDGSVYSLRFFVTPDDPAVIRYTRDILLQYKDSLNGIRSELEGFQKARILFNAFAGKLVYVNDPKQSADNVQYPSETLQLRGGDCDDMTTCFSSLLNSIGISTAFVDVIPAEDSSKSHIYLMFDTGLDPKYGNTISSNTKRYITRTNAKGAESIWIPIEATVITRGFDAAWSEGAQEYFDDVEVGLGLIKGWVKIVDVY